MKLIVPLEKGYLSDRFGKYSAQEFRRDGNNINSFPFELENVPEGTKSLALTFIDYDSTPVCGFTWIHWIACDIPADVREFPENASHGPTFEFTQGSNSCISRAAETSDEVICGYIGPCPPDKDHRYTLRVYALDCVLGLNRGFYYNELHWAMEGHVLAVAEENIWSRA